MQTEIVISGFGGQGVLFAGKMLAYAAVEAGLHTTWIPSYGPEMRGGTANCTVIISDEEIGSPLVRQPAVVLALNQPSLDKYEPGMPVGGLLILNADLMTRPAVRTDLRVLNIHANKIAEELGSNKLANIVLIGALLEATQVLSLEVMEHTFEHHTSEKQKRFLEANLKALTRGAQLVETVITA